MKNYRIFVINCGSTSTKVAMFENDKCIVSENLKANEEAVSKAHIITDQLPSRLEDVQGFIKEHNIELDTVDMIATRGGPTPYCEGGAYAVNQLMIDVLTHAPITPHASLLSCMIGSKLAEGRNIPCIIYDSLTSDEFSPVAKFTGFPGVDNKGGGHVLNSRAVGHMVADKMGRKLEDCRFIVAHLGGGISIISYINGKGTDNSYTAMTPERAGALQILPMINECYSGKYTKAEMVKFFMGKGGFVAYLGTSDTKIVSDKAMAGDEQCEFLIDAMVYQLSKCVGGLAAAMDGDVDRVIVTGGIAKNEYVVNKLLKKIKFIAPVEIIPGELEMEALAGGALRVLKGEEEAKVYDVLPVGFETKEEFYEKFGN